MGHFEVDVLWLYILGALIVIGVVVGAIICCCSGEKKPEAMGMMEADNKNKMEGDMEKMMGDDKMMMEPAMMEPAAMEPAAMMDPPAME